MAKTDKKSKSKMSESAGLTQALMRCPGLGIYIVQDGRFIYANSLFQELTGYTEQELLGMYPLDLVHPEDREAVREKAIENLKGNRVLPYEYRFIRKSGDVMWILERLASIRYRGKRAAVGSFMDVTEHRQMEEALQESESHLKTIFGTLQTGVLIISADTHEIVDANPRAVELIGATKEKIVGKICHEFVCPAEKGKCPITDLGQT